MIIEAIATAARKNTENTAQIQPLQLMEICILEVTKNFFKLTCDSHSELSDTRADTSIEVEILDTLPLRIQCYSTLLSSRVRGEKALYQNGKQFWL